MAKFRSHTNITLRSIGQSLLIIYLLINGILCTSAVGILMVYILFSIDHTGYMTEFMIIGLIGWGTFSILLAWVHTEILLQITKPKKLVI